MPESDPTPLEQAQRADDLERSLVALDALVRATHGRCHVADACTGVARYLRARDTLEYDLRYARRGAGDLIASGDANVVTLGDGAVAPPASAQPATPPTPPAAAPASPAVAPLTAPGGPPCEEQTLQKQDGDRRARLAKDGLAYLERVNYYLQLAAGHAAATAPSDGKPFPNTAGIADAFGSIDCLPVPHALVAAADLAAGQATWDQCYAAFSDLQKAGMIDGDDEASILFALGDRPGTIRIVPGDERDPVADDDGGETTAP